MLNVKHKIDIAKFKGDVRNAFESVGVYEDTEPMIEYINTGFQEQLRVRSPFGGEPLKQIEEIYGGTTYCDGQGCLWYKNLNELKENKHTKTLLLTEQELYNVISILIENKNIKKKVSESGIELVATLDDERRGNIGVKYNIVQNDEIVGEIVLNKYVEHPIKNSYSVAWAKVTAPGKGLGTKAYIELNKILSREGKKLVSDVSRTDAAEKLWKSFENKGLAEKVYMPKKEYPEGKKGFRINSEPNRGDYVYKFI